MRSDSLFLPIIINYIKDKAMTPTPTQEIKTDPQQKDEKHLCLFLDADNTIMPTSTVQDQKPQKCYVRLLSKDFFDNNPIFIECEATTVEQGYTHVWLVPFSLRTCLMGDRRNAHLHARDALEGRLPDPGNVKIRGSFPPILEAAKNTLRERLPDRVNVEIFPALLADVFAFADIGNTFALIKRHANIAHAHAEVEGLPIYGYEEKTDVSDEAHFDQSKLNILYFATHALAEMLPNTKFDCVIYDDDLNMLEQLEQYFQSPLAKSLIPKTMSVDARHYDQYDHLQSNTHVIEKKFFIKGSGAADPNYRALLLKLKEKYPDTYFPVTLTRRIAAQTLTELREQISASAEEISQKDAYPVIASLNHIDHYQTS